MPSLGKSTILSLQESVFRRLDPNINVSISEDQTMLTVTNISEEIFPHLIFITNIEISNNTEHEIPPEIYNIFLNLIFFTFLSSAF